LLEPDLLDRSFSFRTKQATNSLAGATTTNSKMTTTIVATVLSALSKPGCSYVFNPCVFDRIDSKSSVNSASLKVDNGISSINTSHLPTDIPSVAGNIAPRSARSSYKGKTPASGRTGPSLPKGEPTPLHHRDDHTHTTTARALRTRIENLEERCDRCKQELRKLVREVAQDKSAHPRGYKSNDDGKIEVADISPELDSHTTSKAKQRQRRSVRSVRSVGSAIEPPLPSASTKARSRQRRALDLGINGTPKFRLNHDDDTATRPKMVRLQNRWRRVGGR
jgi:hypothetical protein